jgi:hypothetical protein
MGNTMCGNEKKLELNLNTNDDDQLIKSLISKIRNLKKENDNLSFTLQTNYINKTKKEIDTDKQILNITIEGTNTIRDN